MAKRILKEFRLDFLSIVDQPAQEGASLVLRKRSPLLKRFKPKDKEEEKDFVDRYAEDADAKTEEPDEKKRRAQAKAAYSDARKMAKGNVLLSDEDGHSHLLDDSQTSGETSWTKSAGDEYGHAHPWVKNPDGTITIGMADGHTHRVLDPNAQKNQGAEKTMTPEQIAALQKRNEELAAELAVAKAYGNLNDAERMYHRSLPSSDQDGFVKMSGAERTIVLAKADESNPVVFTSEGGEKFRKSDDPRLVALAKRNDELAKSARESATAAATATLEKRAGDELSTLPGKAPAKVALLKAIDGIADEPTRKEIGELLKAANAGFGKAFERAGTIEGGPGGSPAVQLETMAKSYAEKNKVTIEAARDAVLRTKEGEALYVQSTEKGQGT